MHFAWDREKSARNVLERGFDFEFAVQVFGKPTLEREDDRRDYGEKRYVAVGLADGVLLTVVYTDRTGDGGAVRRIVSARRSNGNERKAYLEAIRNR